MGYIKGGLIGALIGLVAVTPGLAEKNVVDILSGKEEVRLAQGEVEIPRYSNFEQRPGLCSAYVRKVGEEVFGKNYSFSNAWDRRYEDRFVSKVDSLDSLENSRVLQPGMLVGMKYEDSKHSDEIDKNGNPVRYTHIGIYLGEGRDGSPIIAHQFGANTRIDSESKLRDIGLKPVEILDSRD
jgi:hypothetical protein